MSKRLVPLIKAFGLIDGIIFFIRRIFKKDGWYASSRYNTRIYLRKKYADNYTFKQVFLEDQYNFNIPFTPATIIDGGANIGLASVYFAHRYPSATIVAVEPSQENFKVVEKNIAGFSKVTAKLGGIWNENKHLAIVNAKDNDNAFMVEEVDAATPGSIPAYSIGSIMQEMNWSSIDLLKLDIEGSEKEVFEKNYECWLPHTKMIIIEVHDHMRKGAAKSVFTAMNKYHFSFSMHHENLLFINLDL
ncbi:MAG: FkbM family methyltransferase [Bacteroidetes bacterium]|jgi:FkbM family methyltransferase|nr:FkbM family methyltransferase [Bacteroidota bacterium]